MDDDGSHFSVHRWIGPAYAACRSRSRMIDGQDVYHAAVSKLRQREMMMMRPNDCESVMVGITLCVTLGMHVWQMLVQNKLCVVNFRFSNDVV